MQNAISMYSMWRCNPVSNLTHFAPQDTFSLMPNCSLGHPEYEKKMFSKITNLGYVKMHGNHGNPYCDSYGCVCVCGGGGVAVHTNSIIS